MENLNNLLGTVKFKNPFAVESPEKLSAKQLVALFVKEYTRLDAIEQRKHTFVWGARGSGKSIMLRYLEPQCAAIASNGLQNYLKQDESFIGIYCPCKEGQFNKSEFNVIDASTRSILTEHLLNLSIVACLVGCLQEQFPEEMLTTDERRNFTDRVVLQFDSGAIATSLRQASLRVDREKAPLAWLGNLLEIETNKISSFLRDLIVKRTTLAFEGATTGYHDFLLPVFKAVQYCFSAIKGVPCYVLLDDADRLSEDQAKIVNSWIANRDHHYLCLKVSANRDRYKTFITRDGSYIEQPHDYSEVDVEELYTQSKGDYSKKVKLISDRRLLLSELPTKIVEEFLPVSETEQKLLKIIRTNLESEWQTEGRPGRLNDYLYRYAHARLFQELAAKKQPKSYAGFQNLVDLSSGIVRDFLEPCYLMLDRELSSGKTVSKIRAITVAGQDEVLRRYSEEFILDKIEDIKKGLPPETYSSIGILSTFITSLGKLFYARLHDPKAREARLFSFTIRGKLEEKYQEVLNIGVRFRYFQLRTYSSKEGGGREKWYILNRRVCPAFKLDPSGFEGRISLTASMIRIACENPEKFVKARLDIEKSFEEPDLFSAQEVN